MKTIAEWQKAAYGLSVSKGFHDCRACNGTGWDEGNVLKSAKRDCDDCPACNGTGRCDPHSPMRIASRLERIHSEISEAGECVARGRMELYYNHSIRSADAFEISTPHALAAPPKPEGFPVELADVFLRTCDLAESLGLTIAHDFDKRHTFTPLHDPEEISAALANLHWEVGGILGLKDVPEVLDGALSWFMRALHQIALATGVDLLAMAELKHSFNATRPLRHGGKIL